MLALLKAVGGGGLLFGVLFLTGDWRGKREKRVHEKADIGA
jgi:hypothetical protein